ncbi:MAG: DUF2207 domain-containing protein [Candidatus Omnitrophica bacterium]|nr:DUF2207 domain-containing protein [Candidatus Omnitrophota bacterium]
MKKVLTALFFTFCLAASSLAWATERILSFHSDVDVHYNGSMAVTETIRVHAEGQRIRHGIYRDFPTHYRGRGGENVVVDFNLVSVLRDGVGEDYHTAVQPNGIRIYIGRKDSFLPQGDYTYVVTYSTNRQLGFFKDHDELYWNVTGNGWAFDIEQASATVNLPRAALDKVKFVDAFTGGYGAVKKNFSTRKGENGEVVFETTRALSPREGLTVLVTWPKGYVEEPSSSQKFELFVKDNLGIIFGVSGVIVLFLFFFFVWNQVGRDPEKGTIIPLFYPPEGLSPADVRYLMKMGYDQKIIACAVINMAVKGYLTIEEQDSVRYLRRTEKKEDVLLPEEKDLAKLFFSNGMVLKLSNENYEVIGAGVRQFQRTLARNFENTYFVTNRNYFLIGLALSLAVVGVSAALGARQPAMAVFMGFWLSIWTVGTSAMSVAIAQKWQGIWSGRGEPVSAVFLTLFSLPFFAGEVFGLWLFAGAVSIGVVMVLVAVIVMDVVFYHLLKAPTMQGRKIMDQVEGFKMYLSVAEKDRLQMAGAPVDSKEIFEKYLPYALALNVEQPWSDRFARILEQAGEGGRAYHPSWYSGALWSSTGCAGFASILGGTLSNTISSSAVAPGSSSGGGGGGFSGGGGGGGGGGGW